MRLFVLPVSTRQALIYCQRHTAKPGSNGKPSISDRVISRANKTWLEWEKKEKGWQKSVTNYGNMLFQRLPYQEYGLKSIPALTSASRARWEKVKASKVQLQEVGKQEVVSPDADKDTSETSVSVQFPTGLIEETRVMDELKRLGSEDTQSKHRRLFAGTLLAMPFTVPFAVIPIVPNLPFFYLVFRAWSHWKAWSGSEHLQFLLQQNILTLQPSRHLRMAYMEAALDITTKQIEADTMDASPKLGLTNGPHTTSTSTKPPETDEQMLLPEGSGKLIAKWLDLPNIHAEIDRAVWQVNKAIQTKLRSEQQEQSKKKQ